MLKIKFVTLLISMLSANVYADIEISFKDGAPKDEFVIKNTSTCDVKDISMTIDLLQSTGRLIFDTSESGKGVEVFQLFEVTRGQIALKTATKVNDGDTQLSLDIKAIAANDFASFTIDVDDTLSTSQLGNIRVTGNEIANASVLVNIHGDKVAKAAFDLNGKARVIMPKCSA